MTRDQLADIGLVALLCIFAALMVYIAFPV